MEHRLAYQQFHDLLSLFRRPEGEEWLEIRSLLKLKEYSTNEIFIDFGDEVRAGCMIYDGSALGFEEHGESRQLERIWQKNELVFLAEPMHLHPDIFGWAWYRDNMHTRER